jgi:LacI family transcriptional regulator
MSRVTSKEVAQRAGVSQSVVSAVLNGTPGIRVSEETRKTVLKAIKDLNYQVDIRARGLRKGRTYCIAAMGNMKTPFFFQMLEGAMTVSLQSGYSLQLYGSFSMDGERDQLLSWFTQRRIDGIITQDVTSYNDPQWLQTVQKHRVPYVSVEGYPENYQVSSVMMNYTRSIEMALDFMWERVPIPPVYLEIYGDKEYKPNWGDRQRLASYKAWMEKKGLKPQVVSREDVSWEEDQAWWLHWLGSAKTPIAVLSNWSRGANRLYRAAYRLGLQIGKDVHVMAADNTERVNEYLVPVLSSIEVPYAEMGAKAAQYLIDYIEGKKKLEEKEKIWLSPKLIVGESVGRANG